MKKICLYIGALCCLSVGCSDPEPDKECTQCPNTGGCLTQEEVCQNSDLNYEFRICQKSECPDNALCPNKKAITLYYDTPRSISVLYNAQNKSGVALMPQGNDCVEFLTNQTETESTIDEFPVTDENGFALFTMKAKKHDCESGEIVKICLADNTETCAEIMVSTTSDTAKIDTNNNLMIDEYETNTDKDKFSNYKSGDCSSYCHDDADCEDFCDSAMGYKCSTRCTNDAQCISYQDKEDENGTWNPMICRKDGRCAYPEFKVVYDIKKAGAKVTLGGQPYNQNSNVTIDWGDNTYDSIPGSTNNNLSHTFAEAKKYTVTIRGDYRNWVAGCSNTLGIDVYDVLQFGPIGLGDDGNIEHGSFVGCNHFNNISAKDIPDASKLTSMNSMFSGLDVPAKGGVDMDFNNAHIGRWDTSNVTSMYRVFFNNAGKTPFNQDIGRWNVSRVKSMRSMFQYATHFNAYIGCWNVSSLRDISFMFNGDPNFNQNLENWNLSRVTDHERVVVRSSEEGFHHIGNISLKNYCILRSKLDNEDIGRNDTKCITGWKYNTVCDDNRWKDIYKDKYQQCLAKKSEDDLTCSDLINCKVAEN